MGKESAKLKTSGIIFGWISLTLIIFGILIIVFQAGLGENNCIPQLA